MSEIRQIRELFDLGVTIELGDDGIVVTGRDSFDQRGDSYIETVYEFPPDTDMETIFILLREIRQGEGNE